MLTKGAIGNLVNRYRAVLKKCNLINTFGSLAVASMLVLGGAGVASAADYTFTLTENVTNKAFTEIDGLDTSHASIIVQGVADADKVQLVTPSADAGKPSVDISGSTKSVTFKNLSSFSILGSTYTVGATRITNGASFTLDNITTVNLGSEADPMAEYGINTTSANTKFSNIGTLNIYTSDNAFTTKVDSGNGAAVADISADNINVYSINNCPVFHSQFGNGDVLPSATVTFKMTATENLIAVADNQIVAMYDSTDGAPGNARRATMTHSYNAENISFESKASSALRINSVAEEDASKPSSTMLLDVTATDSVTLTGKTQAIRFTSTIADNVDNIGATITGKTISLSSDGTGVELNNTHLNLNATETVTINADTAMLLNGNSEATVTAQKFNTSGSITLAENATLTLNLAGASTINGALAADGDVAVSLNSGDASLTVGSSSGDGTVTVSGSGAANDAAGGTKAGLLAKVKGVEAEFGGMEEGFLYGAVDENGNSAGPNTAIEDTLEVATAAPLAIGRIVMNDVRKRMGDLRSTKEESGVWMRWEGGKLKGGEGLTNNFNTIQVGADTMTGLKNVRAGVAAAFTHGDLDHRNGEGEMETYSFSAYGTWMADNGMFADVIARVGFTNTELTMKGNRIDLDNEALSLSAEYGWRFNVCQQFYVEPQVELTYTYLTSADTKVSYADYSVDSMDSLIGRAGLVAGWNLPDDMGNVYARASVVQEFLGDSKLTASAFGNTMAHSEDGQDTWLEYGIGANVKLTDKTYIWADVERTAGADLDEEWRGTVGVRFSF